MRENRNGLIFLLIIVIDFKDNKDNEWCNIVLFNKKFSLAPVLNKCNNVSLERNTRHSENKAEIAQWSLGCRSNWESGSLPSTWNAVGLNSLLGSVV